MLGIPKFQGCLNARMSFGKKIFNEETPHREKFLSLAEFEWVWYWTNPFARAGALSGDILVILLKEELLRQGVPVPIRTQYINQDLKAFLYEVEAHKEMRVKHWEQTQ